MTEGLVCARTATLAVVPLAQRDAEASLAASSQHNNKHATQANSTCPVVNGGGYTSWRPGRVSNTTSPKMELGVEGW